MSYEKIESEEERPSMVEPPTASPQIIQVTGTVVETPAAAKPKMLLKKFFFCMELATGVKFYGILDIISGMCAFVAALFLLTARVSEHAFDKSIAKGLETLHYNETGYDSGPEIQDLNKNLNEAMWFLPFVFILGCIMTYMGTVALRAEKDLKCAAYYSSFKFFYFIYALFTFNFMHILLSGYAFLVCRSHCLDLATNLLPTTTSTLLGNITKATIEEQSSVNNPIVVTVDK